VFRDWQSAEINMIDKSGRRADFHALRMTFCTLLENAGVPQRVAQEAMRHSDPRLTAQVYTDTTQFNLRSAVGKLLSFGNSIEQNVILNIAPKRSKAVFSCQHKH